MDLLEKLHDIEGLDAISAWPLAKGWWVVIAVVFALLCNAIGYLVYRIIYERSWRRDTFKKLALLEKNLSHDTAQQTVMYLSEYLRRIALSRFTRLECAGLHGEAWLKWLTDNDPKQFDWLQKGTLLVEVPYMKENTSLPCPEVKNMIHAVREWVR